MANFPTSLDTLTNPISSNTLDSPSHSGQHTDANDILEAVETKLGTGASTPTTAGHVLTVTGAGATAYQAAAGGASAGLKRAAALHGAGDFRTGRYYDGDPTASGFLNAALNADQLTFSPIYVPAAFTADRIAVEVTTLVASSLIRLGIYTAHATTGLPDSRVLDAGTVDSSTTGSKQITISQAFSADTVYWLCCVSGSNPQITHRYLSGAPSIGATDPSLGNGGKLQAAFTMGALPADTSGLTWNFTPGTQLPRVLVRVA